MSSALQQNTKAKNRVPLVGLPSPINQLLYPPEWNAFQNPLVFVVVFDGRIVVYFLDSPAFKGYDLLVVSSSACWSWSPQSSTRARLQRPDKGDYRNNEHPFTKCFELLWCIWNASWISWCSGFWLKWFWHIAIFDICVLRLAFVLLIFEELLGWIFPVGCPVWRTVCIGRNAFLIVERNSVRDEEFASTSITSSLPSDFFAAKIKLQMGLSIGDPKIQWFIFSIDLVPWCYLGVNP